MLKTLLISLLMFCKADPVPLSEALSIAQECNKIDVTYEITNTTQSLQNGAIKLIFNQVDRSQFSIYFLTGGEKKEFESKSSSIHNLAKGNYSIVITGKKPDDNFCQRFIDIKVK